jgi:rare lipoprotein A
MRWLIFFLALVCPRLLFAGTASWYGDEFRGKIMANGKPFDPDAMTCASWFYPLGTKLVVTRKTPSIISMVVVTVTDRGPSRANVKKGRVIDLSEAAFKCLAPLELGLVEVTVKKMEP